DHFTASPDCRVPGALTWRVGSARGRPTICGGVISTAGVNKEAGGVRSAPDDHLISRPHCCVGISAIGRTHEARLAPAIRSRTVSSARVRKGAAVAPAPDNHLTAGPHCRVIDSGSGRVVEVSGCPSIGARIVSAAVIEFLGTNSTPDDHLGAG